MTTTELIVVLRNWQYPGTMREILLEADDRLEELDERLDIMRESMDENWGKNYS